MSERSEIYQRSERERDHGVPWFLEKLINCGWIRRSMRGELKDGAENTWFSLSESHSVWYLSIVSDRTKDR